MVVLAGGPGSVVRSRGLPGDGLQHTGSKPGSGGPRGATDQGLGATSFFPQPFGVRGRRRRAAVTWPGVSRATLLKGLILAQNERWRRGLGMQVERARPQGRVSGARVSKATVTHPGAGNSRGKPRVMASDVGARHRVRTKASASWDGPSWY